MFEFFFKYGCNAFQCAGCNEQVFLLNPEKNWSKSVLTQKTHTLIPKNDVTEPKAIYSNNQFLAC